MQDKLGKTLEILFEPKINSLKLGKITLGCYKPTPLIGTSSRDSDGLASKKIGIRLPQLIFSLLGSLVLRVVTPLNTTHLDVLVSSNSLGCLQNLHRMLGVSQIFLYIQPF
jgi:hypothetical protein